MRVQGWTTIDVTRGGDGHPYVAAWWPDSHGLGYEHAFVNQASDILTVIGGGARLFRFRFRRRADDPARAPRGDRVGPASRARHGRRDLETEKVQETPDVRDQTIRAEVHADQRAHRRAAGAHAARAARRGSRSGHRGVARVRGHPRRRLHPALRRPPPDARRRARRGDARPGRQHARSAQALRQGAGQARARRDRSDGRRRSPTSRYFDNMLHEDRRFGGRSTTSCCA